MAWQRRDGGWLGEVGGGDVRSVARRSVAVEKRMGFGGYDEVSEFPDEIRTPHRLSVASPLLEEKAATAADLQSQIRCKSLPCSGSLSFPRIHLRFARILSGSALVAANFRCRTETRTFKSRCGNLWSLRIVAVGGWCGRGS
ncbi:hypothetical protein Droror1_Dr00020000 [Drosera rotundifolia]